MAITTLLLDADGVLQHPPVGWRTRILELTGARDWGEVGAVEDPLMTGAGDLAAAFEAGFPRRSVGVAEIIAFWNHTVVDAVALGLVDQVRAGGVRCYLASNQQRHRAAYMRSALPYPAHLDGLFFSAEVGLAKPDPAFFAHILDAVGAAASETLFVDDMAANVAGARAAGLLAERAPRVDGAAGVRAILERHGLLPDGRP